MQNRNEVLPLPTLAERFVADGDALAFEAPYDATDTYSNDTLAGGPVAELAFPDGSKAHYLAYDWRVGALPAEFRGA